MLSYRRRMDRTSVEALLDHALDGRRLLDHPFYQRWQAGELEASELGRYAEQYRRVEAELPRTLAAIASRITDPVARELVEANLADELRPTPHVALFEGFAAAAGAREPGVIDASPATERLVGTYREAAGRSPLAALAVVAAYESQAGEIATSKAAGLRDRYGYGPEGTEFWDVHAALESGHADWTLDALARLSEGEGPSTAATLLESMTAGATAWWDWLSEREAEHAAAAA